MRRKTERKEDASSRTAYKKKSFVSYVENPQSGKNRTSKKENQNATGSPF